MSRGEGARFFTLNGVPAHTPNHRRSPVRFFTDFHRSIADREFYPEIVKSPSSRGRWHLITLVCLAVVLTTIISTSRTLDPNEGLAPVLAQLLSSVSIADGILIPDRPAPYPLDKMLLARVWGILAGGENVPPSLVDSLVVVDTSSGPLALGAANAAGSAAGVRVFLRRTSFEVHSRVGGSRSVDYAKLFPGRKTVQFTAAQTQGFLMSVSPVIVLLLLARELAGMGWSAFFAVMLLSTATYFFKAPRVLNFRAHVRVACFAVGPLVAGSVLMSFANSHLLAAWYFFFCVSLFIHLRGIDGAARAAKPI